VVLVSAPPGYGKTTLVTTWLAAEGIPAAWLTLDSDDDDPAVFLAYLVAAARRAIPGLDAADVLAPAGAISPVTSLAPLLNSLGSNASPLAIVLDDYHAVSNREIHELTAFLATHLPGKTLLVVLTRQDPPLPLARLRVRGQLTEIRAADLRFGVPDAVRFLAGSMGLDLPEPTVVRLNGRAEGWIAGLQLAALSLRGHRDPDAFVDAFGASERYIFDYLVDEALARQPAEVRAFLEATCVIERLSAPLCDAVADRTDSRTMLDALADANVFVVPLDDRREWYRYHGLFADLVASLVPAERVLELHRRAASWFVGAGLPEPAIRHFLAAGAYPEAAARIEEIAATTMAQGRFHTFLGWCRALPEEVLTARPGVGVMLAWTMFLTGDIAGAAATLAMLPDAGLDDPAAPRRACLEAWFANRRDDPEAQDLARRAIAGIPETDPVFRSLAFTTLGESLVGRATMTAAEAFAEAHRLARLGDRPVLLMGTVYSLAMTDLLLGRRREAEALCRRTVDEVAPAARPAPPWLGMVHLPLGVALWEADQLVQARQHLATGHTLCEQAGLRVTMLGAAEWYEILALHQLGDASAAWRRLDAVRRDAERVGLRRVQVAMMLLVAELLLLEGDAPGALARLGELPRDHGAVLGVTRDRLPLTLARVDLATGRPEAALRTLAALTREQRADGRHGRLIHALAATASARHRLGDTAAAVRALEEAVRRAAAEDYRRALTDPVLGLRELLPRVRRAAPSFVDGLLGSVQAPGAGAASGVARGGRVATDGAAAAQPGAAAALPGAAADESDVPPEALSAREYEVLRLVAAGLSNDEIGRALFISPGTAKWHVHNVIGKLGARNRVTLVARARALGLV
jgi:LuxR family maltose regulon positive regulatory protein